MKSTAFWIRRYLTVVAGVFVLLTGTYLLYGMSGADALREAGIWSVLSGSVFTASRYRQARKGMHCALCRDTVRD